MQKNPRPLEPQATCNLSKQDSCSFSIFVKMIVVLGYISLKEQLTLSKRLVIILELQDWSQLRQYFHPPTFLAL